jgi:hypothetical protein
MSRLIRVTLAVTTFVILGFSSGVLANNNWQKTHPNRSVVKARAAAQPPQSHPPVKKSYVPKRPPEKKMHKSDHQLREEVRAIERGNAGYHKP